MFDDLKNELAEKSSIRFYVRARPSAPKTRIIEKMTDESLKIAIAAPAENGKANGELIKFLSKEFDVSNKNMRIVSGKSARVKLVEVKL